jgi:hypothetical protein
VYLVIHNIDVVRLPGRESIPAHSLQIGLDADSREWTLSATLLGPEAIDAVRPDGHGPAILEASINGHVWQFRVDEWAQSLQFGKRGASIRGRSLSAELGAPWQLPASGASTSLETAQSLAAGFLPDGWALTWPAADWLIPAGAWSYRDKVPIQAIQAIAEAAGAIVIPAKAGRALKVQARYPVAPWSFTESTPDLIIPEASITGLQFGSAVEDQGNAVFVHGGPVGGVLARILRTGTAGDRTIPTVADDLITDTDAALARGIRELAKHHAQPEVRSFTMPLGGAYPLCEVGYLVRVEAGGVHRGIVNAVGIEVGRSGEGLTVRQTVTLGEQTPNLWSGFSALLPAEPLMIGEVLGPAGDGAVTVRLVNGGTLTAKGAGAVGAAVYVRAGRIEGPAPEMPVSEFET